MVRSQYAIILTLLIIGLIILAIPGNRPSSATAQGVTPALPLVAIHVSELTQALETMPAGPNSPKPPAFPDTSGYEWWYTSWHYFVMPDSLKEALRSDGTPYVLVTDADITAGNLLHTDGSPRYPIFVSLAAEAIRDDEIGPLRAYVNAGGFLFVGSSSFTRNPDGTTRGNFALSTELGLRVRSNSLDNWYENGLFTKVADDRIVSHIPSGTLNWHLPLTSEEIPLGTTAGHVVHQNHYAWAVNVIDAKVLANGSSGPLVATKGYGRGAFIYYGIMQPLIGLGGNDAGMNSYMIFRRAIEWAFEAAKMPIVKLSPWRFAYDSAFIVRHDFENDPVMIQSIESIAQSERSKGIQGEYYFTSGTVRVGSDDHQLTDAQKQATIQSLQRAVSLYGATIGSHNGGLPNPVNPTLPPSSYDYWHWGPDEALDTNPPGYLNGKAYAYASISQSNQDIDGWFSGLDNGRAGCGSQNDCPRVWASPYFNSGREDSLGVLEQLGVTTTGEQKLSPFPHWTLSTQTNGRRYAHLSLPVAEWYVGSETAQSLENHTDASMRTGVDFYYDLGLLVNFYGHGSNSNYSSYVVTKPRMWSTNSVGIYDWWVRRSPVVVTPAYSQNGNTASATATISNATDPDTAIEIAIPYWSSGAVGNLQVLFNGVAANPNDYRTTSYGVKAKVGNTISTVEVRYELPALDTPTPTPIVSDAITIGETNILSNDDSGNGNLLVAQQAFLAQSATIQSLSFYVASANGQLRLGIYDDASGNPGTLRAQTAAFTPGVGWNTQDVLAPVLLPAGTYWLAYLPQSNNLHFRVELTGSSRGYSYPYGAMPSTFSSSPLSGTFHFSFYATLLVTAAPTSTPITTPTPTPTGTRLPTITSTPTSTPTNTPNPAPTNTPIFTNTPTNTPTNSPTPPPTNTPAATPTGTPAPTNTPIPAHNYGLSFDGADDVVRASQVPGTGPLTVEARVQPATNNASAIVISGADSSDGWSLELNNGRLTFWLATNQGWKSNQNSTQLQAGQWYHVAGTYANGSAHTFVNGTDSGAVNVGTLRQGTALDIGGITGFPGSFLNGVLDEVRVSNVVRYSANFTPPMVPFTSDATTLALWHFDEGTGQIVSDVSSSGNYGTLGNEVVVDNADPTWVSGYPFPSNPQTPTNTPTPAPTNTPLPGLIFADGFESGNTSAWSASQTDGGDLNVSAAAALVGTNGLQAVLDDNIAVFVTDDRPQAEPRYRARFYFDPNAISMANGDTHYILYGYAGTTTGVMRVGFRLSLDSYQVQAGLRDNGSFWTSTAWFAISDAPHWIEFDWRAATTQGANDGALTFWIDGQQRANLANVDNDTRRIDRVRLGAVEGIDAGTRGTYYFDAFESRRQTYIGP